MNQDQEFTAIQAIQKKLVGKKLTYDEIYAIMDEIAHRRLGDVLTTYFAASGYSKGFSNEEIYYLTKAMVETGTKLRFRGIVADKHSIGGIPGTRTTLIVVPIIAACGFTIPKSSSRAITTPSGTADAMEVLAKVKFSEKEIYRIVDKTKGCVVWGGNLNIAPADDVIIQVEEPLLFESVDKILVSVMAKKVAFGSTHVVIDLPLGAMVKVHTVQDAQILKSKFEYLADKFDIKMRVIIHKTDEPAGKGIGPVLETRDALLVLEQSDDRPRDLEERSLNLTGALLDLCLADSPESLQKNVKKEFGNTREWARHMLVCGKALTKMKEIIVAQKGDSKVTSADLKPGKYNYAIAAAKRGSIERVNSKNVTVVAKILGAPKQKRSGMYLHKKIGDHVDKGETVCTLYSQSGYNLKEAKDSLSAFPIYQY